MTQRKNEELFLQVEGLPPLTFWEEWVPVLGWIVAFILICVAPVLVAIFFPAAL